MGPCVVVAMILGSTNPVGLVQGQGGRQGIAAGGKALPSAPLPNAPGTATAPPDSGGADAMAALEAAKQRLQQHIQQFIADNDQEAHFDYDKSTGLTIVQIVNRSSGELVRQIPTEEVVRIAQYIDAKSAFLDVTA
jgi:flagellar protein FlaG